ncbi:MAG TPA: PhoPQ-activated protein PqaA family protein, partial [Longimicrobiales bacterium]|nr:PhoPQ-activated protein PqaA family protein [Longimicrobiales bacterium]
FNDAVTSPAFDRSPSNGIRLAEYPDTTNLAAASAPIVPEFRDYAMERPVTDDVFDAYRQAYAYDATPLNARVVSSDTAAGWIRERVEMDAAYGGERLTVFLFLPREGTGPRQTVVYFPGSDDLYKRSYDQLDPPDLIVRSGRVLVYPVYKGTYDRGGSISSDVQDASNNYRDHVIAWSKDLGRALDYAVTRPEVDPEKLGYFGISWGSAMAPIVTALEPRIRASVLIVGGLAMQKTQPMVDPFNFLPRVKAPTLLVNARYDSFFPVESSQRPFFAHLGLDESEKRLVITESNHFVLSYAANQAIKETLDWYDRFLGPVR